MTIRQFIPLALLAVGALSYGATKVEVPATPIALIATLASCLLVLQLEDHRLGDLLAELIRAFRKEHFTSR